MRVRVGDLGRGASRRRTRRTRANSRRRPSRTSSASSSLWSVKNRNGARVPVSSPMNSSGICGHSSSSACAARSASAVRQRGQPVADRAVADLVVVLQADDEGGGRQARRSLSPRGSPLARRLALVTRSPATESVRALRGGVLEIGVVAFGLAGQQDVQRVMRVVGPLRVEQAGTAGGGTSCPRAPSPSARWRSGPIAVRMVARHRRRAKSGLA